MTATAAEGPARDTGIRNGTAALCEELIAADGACFGRWCALVDGRGKIGPGEVVASQEPLHQAVGRLRDWCLADTKQAEAERQELLRRQVAGEANCEAARRVHRAAADRNVIRRQWVDERYRLFSFRDAITVGLGWPHRGERVTVSTRYYLGGLAEEIPVNGPAVYLYSHDIFNVTHKVWVPQVSPHYHRGTLLVAWEPPRRAGRLGNADPAGDIAMRVLGAENRRLPVPLPRWPKPEDAGDIGELLFGRPGGPLPRRPGGGRPRRSGSVQLALFDL
jgi:hypothetical protein